VTQVGGGLAWLLTEHDGLGADQAEGVDDHLLVRYTSRNDAHNCRYICDTLTTELMTEVCTTGLPLVHHTSDTSLFTYNHAC
jgi:hypothetical protein